MTLRECMRGHTERELRVWLEWMDMQWNRPDRGDHYMMQAALEAMRGRMKDPGKAALDDMRLRFVDMDAKPAAEEPMPPGCPRRLTKLDIARISRQQRLKELGL